jgi:low affinity Fe/Cu permease
MFGGTICTPVEQRQRCVCTIDEQRLAVREDAMGKFFTLFASKAAKMVGSYWAFLLALLIVMIWGLSGPVFNYSDTWQLVINTGTTIITFLMVFLIQNTQNRDAKAMHLKLDELISAVTAAHNEMIDIEDLSDKQLEDIAAHYRKKKEECGDDTVTAIATDVAQRTAHDTAKHVAGGTAERVAGDKAREVADDTARRVVEEKTRRVA